MSMHIVGITSSAYAAAEPFAGILRAAGLRVEEVGRVVDWQTRHQLCGDLVSAATEAQDCRLPESEWRPLFAAAAALASPVPGVRNLTPHAVAVYGGDAVDIAASKLGAYRLREDARPRVVIVPDHDGLVARAAQDGGAGAGCLTVHAPGVGAVEIPLRSPVRFAAPIDLPPPHAGVRLIVSQITADAARASGRDCRDLLTIGDVVRDASGAIVGCLSLREVAS
jgi:hypothetical protein